MEKIRASLFSCSKNEELKQKIIKKFNFLKTFNTTKDLILESYNFENNFYILLFDKVDDDIIECIKKIKIANNNAFVVAITDVIVTMNLCNLYKTNIDQIIDKNLHCSFIISELNKYVKICDTEASFIYLDNSTIKLDIKQKCVYKDDNIMKLTCKQYRLFYYLVTNKNVIISRNELSEYVYGIEQSQLNSEHLRNIDVMVSKIRCMLTTNDIKSIVGEGYIFG